MDAPRAFGSGQLRFAGESRRHVRRITDAPVKLWNLDQEQGAPMSQDTDVHFDSIESAHDFLALLSRTVADTRSEIEVDVERETKGASPRRLAALRLASYKLEKLELHTSRSARLLNDLRSLRRLLFKERAFRPTTSPKHAAAKPVSVTPIERGADEKPDHGIAA